jgi:hypothetical protein
MNLSWTGLSLRSLCLISSAYFIVSSIIYWKRKEVKCSFVINMCFCIISW